MAQNPELNIDFRPTGDAVDMLKRLGFVKKATLLMIAIAAALGALISCSGGTPLQDIARSNSVSPSPDGPVVVFLPGTLASTLVDSSDGDMVWGRDDAVSMDPRKPEGLVRLSLPLDPVPSDVSAAPDLIRAKDVLRRANERVIGIPVSLAIYEDMLDGLAAAGLPETEPRAIPTRGPSLTSFPYDWRRSIVDAAQELGSAIEARGEDAAKVRIVGHSMGGVVALWYLMHGTAPLDSAGAPPPITWAGAKHVDRAVLVGAPLRGSAVAIRNTVNGNKLAGPLVPVFPPAMLASHPSSFELMPRGTVLTGTDAPLMSAATWEKFGWGLTDPNERANIATLGRGKPDAPEMAKARQAALIARGRAFHAGTDRPIQPPATLSLTIIAGTGSETPFKIVVPAEGGEVRVGETADGDGTVLLSSTLAGFEDAASNPNKTVHLFEVEHTRMLSQPDVFEKTLEALTR